LRKTATERIKENNSQLLESIHILVDPVAAPSNYYFGLTWKQSALPDNVVVFRRTNPAYFKLKGEGCNYHHRFELVIPLQASGVATIDDNDFFLKPGSCALVFPNQFHRYSGIRSSPMDWLFITFEVDDAGPYSSLQNRPRVLSKKNLTMIRNLMKTYIGADAQRLDHLDFFYRLGSLLKNLPNEPEIDYAQYSNGDRDNQQEIVVEQIKAYLRDHLADAPDLASMAKELNYSVSYLRAVFRDQIGLSLGKYIREARLAEAAKLLQSSDLKVSDVAERCGFSSLFAFSRAFKRTYQVSPKVYSTMIRKQGS